LSFSETILRDEKDFVTILTLSEKITEEIWRKNKRSCEVSPGAFCGCFAMPF
jgi:hypothetical protein